MRIPSWRAKFGNIKRKIKKYGALVPGPSSAESVAPVFVIGANRSGTSLVAYLLNQHPEVEGIFAGETAPTIGSNGHSIGYCESYHIWDFLEDLNNDFVQGENEGALWGHAKHISKYYRDSVESNVEKKVLANSLLAKRKTSKVPLVKDQWNMLRVGLVKAVFPNAKFVLVIRDVKDYVPSCLHKWKNDKIEINHPNVGLHWHLLNSTAIYDLHKFASGDFSILAYEDLFDSRKNRDVFSEVNKVIQVSDFEYDFTVVDKKMKFQDLEDEGGLDTHTSDISKIIQFEKCLQVEK